ncbi:MAG: metal ABC transporter solute-binding protein, Zn/Mn family [Desulfobaccales bacterium]
MRKLWLLGIIAFQIIFWTWYVTAAQAAPLPVVAAESTYGVIAEAIGGPDVKVVSIINNPNVDPHTFEADPAVAREVAQARVAVMNGIGYDEWMEKLIGANPAAGRQVVIAADLDPHLVMANKNPHIFYDPRVALLIAARLDQVFSQDDPTHAPQFAQNFKNFSQSLLQIYDAAQMVIAQHPALTVTATEPVVGYMSRLLGYESINQKFQFNVMNDTEPAPQDVINYENSLRQHQVAVLFYNQQVTSPLTKRMQDIAKAAGIPIVGVDEFVPPHTGYVKWQVETLQALNKALESAH